MASRLDEDEVLAAQQPASPPQQENTTPLIIPKTSKARLQAAAHDSALNVDALVHGSEGKAGAPDDVASSQKTILYLAYGSNLSSTTFRKTRGIVPISQTNVYVPSLALTFDLPGLPYVEPCFAGTQYRDVLKQKSRAENDNDDDDENQRTPPTANGHAESATLLASNHKTTGDEMKWHKSLVGVVYEVTLAQYARIIATEGGGASYIDVVVPCHPFPEDYDPAQPVPDQPSTPSFMAHTLLSPAGSRSPSSHLSRPPYYAQPSARYKNLLVTGAKEHDLPADYRAYLTALPSYHTTSIRQRIGLVVFAAIWSPFLLLTMVLGRTLADERGRSPGWLAWLQRGLFEGMWWSYDEVFRKVAGEGERTVE